MRLQSVNADILGISVGSGEHFTAMNSFIAEHRIHPVIDQVFDLPGDAPLEGACSGEDRTPASPRTAASQGATLGRPRRARYRYSESSSALFVSVMILRLTLSVGVRNPLSIVKSPGRIANFLIFA